MEQFLIGIDEAGRGPLAGPVAVGVVRVPKGFSIRRAFPGVNDSKKLSPKRREEIYQLLVEKRAQGVLDFTVQFSSAAAIDRLGITKAISRALFRGLTLLAPNIKDGPGYFVLLDGSLKAPPEFVRQKTIIRGDASEPVISLASIAAKVERDRLMRRLSKKYPDYHFDIHKGYGTRAHYAAIAAHSLSPVHRTSFIHTTR